MKNNNTYILFLVSLILIDSIHVSAQSVLNDPTPYAKRVVNTNITSDLSAQPANSINYIKARDGVNLQNGFRLSAAGLTQSAVIKADNTIVLPIVISGATGSSSSLDDFYLPTPANDSYIINTNSPVGATPISASVAATGGATFQIPIDIPAGPAGIKPNLSITYSSLMGNGLLGWGCNLSGLSSIYRVTQNQYFDGNVSALQLNRNDRIAMDGVRLIQTSAISGTTKFIAETNPYIDITGSIVNSIDANVVPDYIAEKFTVKDKSGNITTYGLQNNSSVNGGNYPLAWKINNFQDANGNRIDYFYDNTGGENHINKITYGNNGSGIAPYEILFRYSSRQDDAQSFYAGGNSVNRKLLLKSILVTSKGTGIKEYFFDYALDANVSKLINVTEKNENTVLNATQVNWHANTASVTYRDLKNDFGDYPFPDIKSVNTGDFNGDGLKDIVVLYGTSLSYSAGSYNYEEFPANLKVLIGQRDGTFKLGTEKQIPEYSPELTSPYQYKMYVKVWVADSDNDGIDEIFTKEYRFQKYQNSSGQDEYLGNGNTYYYKYNLEPVLVLETGYGLSVGSLLYSGSVSNDDKGIADNKAGIFQVGDYDGDGKTDLLFLRIVETTSCTNSTYMCDSDYMGLKFCYSQTLTNDNFSGLQHSNVLMPIDINSDGKTEILQAQIHSYTNQDYINTSYVFSLNGTTQSQLAAFSNNPVFNNNKILYPEYGDFNGDGQVDILGYYYSRTISSSGKGVVNYSYFYKSKIYLNTGGSFQESTELSQASQLFLPEAGPETANPSTSNSPSAATAIDPLKIFSGDFNGDGMTDLLYIKSNPNPIPNVWDKYIFVIAYSTGKSFNVVQQSEVIDDFDKNNLQIADFNRDGNSDVLIVDKNGTALIWYMNRDESGNGRLVSSVTNGMGLKTSFTYAPPIDNGDYYTRSSALSFPLQDMAPLWVVTKMTQPDGIGGTNSVNFSYAGGYVHRQGKGFLGFGQITKSSTELKSKTIVYNSYNAANYIPYNTKTEVYYTDGNKKISTMEYSNKFYNVNGKSYFYYIDKIKSTNGITEVVSTQDFIFDFSNYGELIQKTSYNSVGAGAIAGYESVTYEYGDYGTGSSIRRPATESFSKKVAGNADIYTRNTSYETYDGNGRLTKVIYDKDIATEQVSKTFTYDTYGNLLTALTEPINDKSLKSSYTYSPDGRYLYTEQVGTLPAVKYEYDEAKGYIKKKTGENGLFTSYDAYDVLGRITKITDALGIQTTYAYDWAMNGKEYYKTQVHTPGDPDVTTYLDAFGRELRTESQAFNSKIIATTQEYDAMGRLTFETLPHYTTETAGDYKISYTYVTDGSNRIYTVTDRNRQPATYTYQGLTTQVTDPAGKTTSVTTDASGLITSSADALTNSVTYPVYDPSGQPKKITANNSDVNIGYDAYGKKTSVKDVSSGTITYGYNPLGMPNYQKDNRGNEFTIEYDALGRISKKTLTGGYTINYDYNASGSAVGQVDAVYYAGSVPQKQKYDYDSKGRVIKTTETIAPTWLTQTFTLESTVAYDNYGRVFQRKYPSGFTVTYEYDNTTGILTKIKNNTTTLWELQDLRANGQPVKIKYGNGIVADYLYQGSNAYQSEHKLTLPNGTIYKYGTSFNINNGNLDSRTNFETDANRKTECFTYDNLDRLTGLGIKNTAGNCTNVNSISYSANGNIDTKFDAGQYTYTKPNQAQADVNIYAVSQVDPTGAGTANAVPMHDQTISYNDFNKVSTVSDNGYSLTFAYGTDRDRIAMREVLPAGSAGGGTSMIYGNNYEAQVDANGNIIKEWTYINGQDGLVAVYINDNGVTNLYYAHTDHLGSVLLLSDQTGAIAGTDKYNYDPWGRRRDPVTLGYLSQADILNLNYKLRRGFTFHEHLDNYGLINMNGRLYDPVLGRMLNPDPVIPDATSTQSYNAYAYVFNNPLKYTDPNGDCPICPFIFIGAIIGAMSNGVAYAMNTNNSGSAGGFWAAVGIGGIAGGVGALAGGAAVGIGFAEDATLLASSSIGFWAGAGAGALGGGVESIAMQAGNSLAFGTPFSLEQLGISALGGAVFGGAGAGINAVSKGRNFWSGRFRLKNAQADLIGWRNGRIVNAQHTPDDYDLNYELNPDNSIKYYIGMTPHSLTPGISVYKIPFLGAGLGVTLPPLGIFVGAKSSEVTIQHEYGHYLQYNDYGFYNYYSKIGLPSLLADEKIHPFYYTETDANNYATRYFGKNSLISRWPQ